MGKIIINNVEWEIKELDQSDMNKYIAKYQDVKKYDHYLGYCDQVKCTILINKDSNDKKATLYHELIHAYMWSVGITDKKQYSAEDICEVACRSYEIISKIVDEYKFEPPFKETLENIITGGAKSEVSI